MHDTRAPARRRPRLAILALLTLGLVGCADEPEAEAGSEAPRRLQDARTLAPERGDAIVADDSDAAPQDPGSDDPLAADAGVSPDAEPAVTLDGGAPEDGGLVCARTSARAEAAFRPVDILWVIDSSPSMDDEIAIIQDRLNAFTARIADSGLDYRVALVGAEQDLQTPGRDYFGICIPPPLSGAPGCPDTDSETYRHVRAPVHSADGLDVLLASMDQLRGFLRPEARLHVVMVSDDDHRQPVTLEDLTGAGLGADLAFHSIVTLLDYVGGCGVFDENEACSCGDARGRRYIELTERTDGLVLDLCSEDWDPLFDGLREQVEVGARIPCAFQIPELPGAVVDPARVNVVFVAPDGTRTDLFNVDDCAAHPDGWRFDNPEAPTRVLLCPDACGAIEGDVEVEFGCEIRKV